MPSRFSAGEFDCWAPDGGTRLVLSAGLVVVLPCAGAPLHVDNTDRLTTPRDAYTPTLPPNDKVLAAGSVNTRAHADRPHLPFRGGRICRPVFIGTYIACNAISRPQVATLVRR